MKRWRFNTLLLIAILSCCLVTISANADDDDDDGVTIEAEKIVRKKSFHITPTHERIFSLIHTCFVSLFV